ncbi:MAG: DUF1016 N-terminal domain-containing protein [Thermoguttaceae bacterium]|nr:DUF1016 N-terminal domain-containing protein [Thermoguttaceae bacterium]
MLTDISSLLDQARRMSARTVNRILTATYWEIGRRIVEYEQGGEARAEYGAELLKALSRDLAAKYGRGFSRSNLQLMRLFYAGWEICQTPFGKLEWRAKLPPILCSDKDDAVVHYAMGHMPAKVFASRYLTDLPDAEMLRREILETKHALEQRAARRGLPNA